MAEELHDKQVKEEERQHFGRGEGAPSEAPPLSPVLKVTPDHVADPPTLEGEQALEPTCAYDCIVHAADRVECGSGTIACKKGYVKGKHYWEFTVKECGMCSMCGVVSRDPGDDMEVLHGHGLCDMEAGYAICGNLYGGSSPAFHAGLSSAHELPQFRTGDCVGLLLDCDAGVLIYRLNGKTVGRAFEGQLHSRALFPAFGGTSLETEFVDIRFDLPIPTDV
eukprot:TRINITY_DN18925_c0_g1_i1.p1 TRINITY_DN18925_c0_g1~~TRINITY_DN18925_c0_g1_i1.p1  ORF type:complete len:222 (-),score=70.02 TRINITY_DN18925_c0_g1_i1:60-725(-)